MGLTKKQAAVLEFVREFIESNQYAPTLEEIAGSLGISAATVHEHVRALERQNLIRSEPRRARSIEIVGASLQHSDVPILGQIAAGLPIEAISEERSFDLQSLFPRHAECFILEVRGHSMIDDHIQDGDLVVVERRQQARMGETVVALIREQEATLKRYYPERDRVRLEPANATMHPIYVSKDELAIQGVVIGLIRNLR